MQAVIDLTMGDLCTICAACTITTTRMCCGKGLCDVCHVRLIAENCPFCRSPPMCIWGECKRVAMEGYQHCDAHFALFLQKTLGMVHNEQKAARNRRRHRRPRAMRGMLA